MQTPYRARPLERVQKGDELPRLLGMVLNQLEILLRYFLGLAFVPADRFVDRECRTIMQELRPHAQSPERRRSNHVDGSLIQTRLVAQGPSCSGLRAGLNPGHPLPLQDFIGGSLQVGNAPRRSLGMLRLRDPIARSDIMQHEVTKGMDDLVAEWLGHGTQVASGRGLAIAVEGLGRR